MTAGHFATGLAVFAAQRERSGIAWLVIMVVSLWPDVLWCLLTPLGLEGGYSLGSQIHHRPVLPWSHSIAAMVGWTAAAWAFCRWVGKRQMMASPERFATMGAVAMVAHYLGDAPVSESFFLSPAMRVNVPMLHLYGDVPVAFGLEAGVVFAGWWWFRSRVGSAKFGITVLVILIVVHLLTFAPSVGEQPAVDLAQQPFALIGYLVLMGGPLVVMTALYIRESRMS